MKKNNITIVNLGNNHIKDHGSEGIESTKEALAKEGINFFGEPSQSGTASSLITEINGVEIALVSFNEWFGKKSAVIDSIKTLSRNYPVVVYTHWGDEYASTTERVKTYAHEFVDAGADLVVGSHPHIVQENEIYNNVSIYYSLGNFIFDQYWNESVRTGLALEIQVKDKEIVSIIPHILELKKDRQTCFVENS